MNGARRGCTSPPAAKLTPSGDRIAAGLNAVATAIDNASHARDERENDRFAKAIDALTRQVQGRS